MDSEERKIEAMVLGRELFDFIHKKKGYCLEDCITVGNEIKKSVYDERERLQNINRQSGEK